MILDATISAEELARGLRYSKRAPRDSKFLVTCLGSVGINNVIKTLKEINRIASSVITDSFPYPQVFVFNRVIVVCSATKIYELIDNILELKITVTTGLTWNAVDFTDYIYFSNGVVAVTRNGGTYAVSTTLPAARGICNMNGQILISGSSE